MMLHESSHDLSGSRCSMLIELICSGLIEKSLSTSTCEGRRAKRGEGRAALVR